MQIRAGGRSQSDVGIIRPLLPYGPAKAGPEPGIKLFLARLNGPHIHTSAYQTSFETFLRTCPSQ